VTEVSREPEYCRGGEFRSVTTDGDVPVVRLTHHPQRIDADMKTLDSPQAVREQYAAEAAVVPCRRFTQPTSDA